MSYTGGALWREIENKNNMSAVAMTVQEQKRFDALELKVDTMEKKLDTILILVKGIAIGLAIGAIVFGWISAKEFISIAK